MGSELGKKQKHRQSPREIETVRGILYSLNARNELFLNVYHEIQKKKNTRNTQRKSQNNNNIIFNKDKMWDGFFQVQINMPAVIVFHFFSLSSLIRTSIAAACLTDSFVSLSIRKTRAYE